MEILEEILGTPKSANYKNKDNGYYIPSNVIQ